MLFKYFNSFVLKYNLTFNCSWYLPLCIYVNKISVEFYWFNNIPDLDLSIIDLVFSTTSKYAVSNSKNIVSLVEMRMLPFTFWINWKKNGNRKWPKLNTLETKMAKISHTRNENGQNFTHQNKITLFWRKKSKINLHQNFSIYGIW
jgi:hypothetical protein